MPASAAMAKTETGTGVMMGARGGRLLPRALGGLLGPGRAGKMHLSCLHTHRRDQPECIANGPESEREAKMSWFCAGRRSCQKTILAECGNTAI